MIKFGIIFFRDIFESSQNIYRQYLENLRVISGTRQGLVLPLYEGTFQAFHANSGMYHPDID